MRGKVTIYKQGFLSEADRELLKQKVAGMGLVESHEPEAISDLEMTVYLKWLKGLVEPLNGELQKELKSHIDQHSQEANPILDYFVAKYGKQTLMGQVPKVLKEVLAKE